VPLTVALALAVAGASAGATTPKGALHPVGQVRVKQAFAKIGVVFRPTSLTLGTTRVITGVQRGKTWPWVSVLIFKTIPEAQRVAAWHAKHPSKPLVRGNTHRGGERTLSTRNLLIVWPTKSPTVFSTGVQQAYQDLLPRVPHPRRARTRKTT
jgi:hypothetical protein